MDITDDKTIRFGLRDYQEDASRNIRKIYSSEKHNRYAGVVLPTGAGKSFVAIEQLLSFGNGNYNQKARNGVINATPMLYIAPQNEILSQVKLHIVKNVLFAIPKSVLNQMTINDINMMMKRDFPTINFRGINTNVVESDRITDESTTDDKINAILKQLTPSQITELVKNAFPNLKFKCYAGVRTSENEELEEDNQVVDVEDEDIKKAEFIIVDEAHRLSASKWGPNFKRSLQKNSKAKVLAITATPDRNDKNGNNVLHTISKMVYPGETLVPSEYVAKEIYVLDAIKDGIVNAPEIVDCASSLANSIQYTELLEEYNDSEGEKREELGEILDEMERIIGFSPRELSEEAIEERREADIRETITKLSEEGKINPNGKYIAFIPPNTTKKGEMPKSAEQFFKEQIERVKEQFKGVVDENGNPVKITVSFVTSKTEVRLDKDGNPVSNTDPMGVRIDNSVILKNFNDASNNSGGIKILLSVSMLDEGVHVDGIDGAIMLRKIESDKVFLQQVGRCISSLNPNKTFEEQPKRLIIDAAGNSLEQINRKTGKKTSHTYDLEKIVELKKILEDRNGEIPNINQQPNERFNSVQAQKEARYAITLKRLKIKYMKYKNNMNISLKNGEVIAEIVKIANEIKLWDMNIPERTIEPSEKELTGNGFLELSPKQKEFMDIYNQYEPRENKELDVGTRINKLINIVRILKNHKKDLAFPQGIAIRDRSEKMIKSSDVKSINLDDILRANFDKKEIEQILVELQDYDLLGAENSKELYQDGERYNLGEEIAFVRGMFWTSKYQESKYQKSFWRNYTVKDLIELGIIQNGREDIMKLNEMSEHYSKGKNGIKKWIVDISKFWDDSTGLVKEEFYRAGLIDGIIGILPQFQKCSLIDGEQCMDRYDIFGYDEVTHFNTKNIHEVTGTKYDERGFYYDIEKGTWINRYSGSEYDLLGYNFYGHNEMGFERPIGINENGRYVLPKWHKRNEDGTYDKSSSSYIMPANKEAGIKSQDAHGFTGINKDGGPDRKYDSKSYTNPEGFYSYGGRRKRPKVETVKNQITRRDFFDDNGLDIDGYNKFNFKLVKVGNQEKYIHRETSCEYDKKGRICTKRGRLVLDSSILIAKDVIRLMLESGHSVQKVYSIYAERFQTTQEEVKDYLVEVLDKAFEIYETSSPNAFDKDENERDALGELIDRMDRKMFKGLDEYYFSDSNSTEKKERLNEFFELCPRAKDKLLRKSKENLRKLEILEKSKSLTKEQEILKKQLEQNKQKYDSIELDER